MARRYIVCLPMAAQHASMSNTSRSYFQYAALSDSLVHLLLTLILPSTIIYYVTTCDKFYILE